MRRPSCPSAEALLETVSIPGEMSRWALLKTKTHLFRCVPCQEKLNHLRTTWNSFFQPEPEVASSLMRVYSRLQRDETLILKGWKLSDIRGARPSTARLFVRSWGFPTGIAVALGLSVVFFSPAFRPAEVTEDVAAVTSPNIPLSPIRTRDRNSVKVRYVRPQLLQSMEFETVSTHE